jgi:hypothetical protein
VEERDPELYPGQTTDFAEGARRAFAWLEDRGFELREVDPMFLAWHSDDAGVLVALRAGPDGASRAVQMGLGPADEPNLERYLSMYRLEELRPPPEDAPFRPLGKALLPASDRDSMRASLERMAELLSTQFAEPLASGSEGLRALKEESLSRVREAVERIRSDDARRDAKEAFDAGDYARATMLYESVTGELRRSERKRLDIARRRTNLSS